jgi:hypothetical protein
MASYRQIVEVYDEGALNEGDVVSVRGSQD